MKTHKLMGKGAFYIAPSCESFKLSPESNMMLTASEAGKYGQSGQAGNSVYEMDELEF